MYAHTGLATFFTLLVLSLGISRLESVFPNILWLEIIGFVLFIPSAFLVTSSLIALMQEGKARHLQTPSTLVDSSIYRIVRHPMFLGTAVWSAALILVFQSILSIVLGTLAIFCFWMASKEEDELNIKKFGKTYGEYIKKVPMWNAFKGLRK
ncbi:MAG: isoprenylcysteine carboxylmethyltransferase family protein [Methanocellales archaeon]|nr:isoprenylcysteine carboxylmethyltransferase family protein [Methanocellales archaeon]MDD3421435.1 isoprenylcysteine carboxylmethyltransferase family protein [Methanocellales archaeon]MDD4898339.1 isoprenylcysteine carboxylmethyltransferase family protein [Methanocellales archaeon]MDD5446646.1 isoprenylcysteine carboxylmethyltransferase family protein [Methanocellales archaeon]